MYSKLRPATLRYGLLTLIILLAFGLRAYRLGAQSLRGDEAASATYATFAVSEILEITRFADPHPPLFYVALGYWEQLVGVSEFAVRFWVLIPGILIIPSIFVLARTLFGAQAYWPWGRQVFLFPMKCIVLPITCGG